MFRKICSLLLIVSFWNVIPARAEKEQELNNPRLTPTQLDSLNEISRSLYIKGNYLELLMVQNQLLRHYQSSSNKLDFYETKLNLADLYRATENHNDAIRICNELLNDVPWSYKELRAKIYAIKAAILFEYKQSRKSVDAAMKSLAMAREVENKDVVANALNIIGAAYRDINMDSAIIFTRLSIDAFGKINDSLNLALAFFNLANTMNTINEIDSSIYYGTIGLNMATKYGVANYQAMSLNNLIDCYIKKEKYKKAIELVQRRDSIVQSITSPMHKLQFNQLMEKLENEKVQQEKDELKDTIELEHKLNNRKNWMLFLAASLLGAMGLILFIVYKNNNQRKKDLNQMADLHKNLKESTNKLQELNRNKDRILSIISHDLRSPFSQLITFLAFAEDGDLTEDEMQQVNREMLVNAKNGLHMLDNLLYWASTQRSEVRLNKTTFLVAEVLKEIKDQMNYLAQGKEVKIQLSCPLTLSAFGDKILFEIIARNLLSNALKFSNPNSSVEISAKEKGNNVEVCIRDFGNGIPPKVLSSLKNNSFDYNSTTGTKGEKGAGMGLYLSMEFAKQNDGNLEFYRENDGTRACIKLPKA